MKLYVDGIIIIDYEELRISNMKKKNVLSKRFQKQLNELASNRQYDEAIRLLEPIARKGNADAQYKMGRLLYKKMTHTGARFVLEDVAYWMNKEKQQAMCPEDYPDANKMIYWYEEAAKQGHIKATVELAEWYVPLSCDNSQVGRIIKQSPSFALKCDLERALSLYKQALDAGDESFLDTLKAGNLLHSRHVPKKYKDKIVDIFYDRAKKGSWRAADLIFNIIGTKLRFPEHKPYYDIEINEYELLHADWFLLLLNHEAECEKEEKYSGKDALRLLSDLAKNGSQEALNMLTDIGMKTKGLSACWAGDVYYERKEYKKALECYLAGEGVYKLGKMYERGEGTTPDMEKAFQYYEEAEDYYNMGRMYEQGTGTEKDLQKAFDCYRKIIDREIYTFESEDEKNKILSTRRSFRRLKKMLFIQKDEIRMTVVAKESESICRFSFISYGDCLFTIDWGDRQAEEINNEKEEEIHVEHIYTGQGEWNICLKSDETHTITSFHYTCGTCILKALNVTQCPILIDLYCVNQELRCLDICKNLRLERLVCRGNKLRTLNIRKNNRLTQLDCSDNLLRHLDWHPRYAALSKVCIKNTVFPEQLAPLSELLKLNKGRMCDAIMEISLKPVCLPLSYYMRCMTWNGIKAEMKKGGYPIWIHHSWSKYKAAFNDMRSRNDFHYAGSNRIVCEGGYTHCECFDAEKKEYVHQDLEDMLINSTPWSEILDMPVLMREKEGWMMFPLATWADVFCACFSEMTYTHWKETEKIVRNKQEFWEWLREQQK